MLKTIIEKKSGNCFLGIEPCSYKDSKFIIVPAPLEKTVSYGTGTSNGPHSIIKASPQLEFYDQDLDCEPQTKGICTLKPLNFTNIPIETCLDKLQKICFQIFKDKKIPLILGGEHSLSIAPIKALKQLNTDFEILHFDAHADLRQEYEGSIFSHACVMKRIFDENIASVSLGIRSYSKEESIFIKQNNLNIYSAEQIINNKETIDNALSSLKSKNIYITFDVDVFDPSIMPSTGTPEPGGLNWYHIMYAFRKLKELNKNVLGFDLVELAPIDNLIHPNFTCAKLLFKTMAELFIS
jgi:agmatinase